MNINIIEQDNGKYKLSAQTSMIPLKVAENIVNDVVDKERRDFLMEAVDKKLQDEVVELYDKYRIVKVISYISFFVAILLIGKEIFL